MLWPTHSILTFWKRGDLVVALTGTVSQVPAQGLPAMLTTGHAEEVAGWVSRVSASSPGPRALVGRVHCSSQVARQWDPHSWPGKGGILPALVPGGEEDSGKRSDSCEERRQEELPGRQPGKGLRQHLSASVSVSAQPLGAWEAARAGQGK